MFAVVQVDAVPRLEYFRDTIKVVRLEPIELYDAVVTRQDLDLISACCTAPLRRNDL
jgi:hypothetical protein